MTSPFDPLKRFTRARIALGRAGDGLPTEKALEFAMAHALARDAIHGDVDWDEIVKALAPLKTVTVKSAAASKDIYLRRPDLGRQLAEGEAAHEPSGPVDIAFVEFDSMLLIYED